MKGGQAHQPMIIETRAVQPFFKNGFVLGCEKTREGIVIDPGDEVAELVAAVAQHKLTIRYILLTHAHLDHISGVGAAKAAFDAPVGLHPDDDFLYEGIVQQGQMFGLRLDPQPKVDFFYAGKEPLKFGELGVWVYHTPGHCPGGVCLAVGRQDTSERQLFVGDTLFAGSIGRTDLPGGDHDTLLRSIREVLFKFPDNTQVFPGHGDPTTIGGEKKGNPFL
jgi:hydroxyacylglutathione hydrolase